LTTNPNPIEEAVRFLQLKYHHQWTT